MQKSNLVQQYCIDKVAAEQKFNESNLHRHSHRIPQPIKYINFQVR